MADVNPIRGADGEHRHDGEISTKESADKRKSTDNTDEASPPKKMSFSFGKKSSNSIVGQKISFNLGGPAKSKPAFSMNKPSQDKPQVIPIKMSLPSAPKTKDPPAVVQKSALAVKAFGDESESDEEEMPPEAKMRMKNIGRDTPTAAGPNSYGKGKQGFVDRQKVIEKQLKEEMEKISGDRVDRRPDK